MVDLHHHLLSGLDDGAADVKTSIAMAKLAAEDGITHVVCTPHANGQYVYDPNLNAARLAEMRDLLAADGVALTLGIGCDFHLSYDNIQEAKADPARFSINGKGYLLVEIPDYGVPRGLTEIFYELQLAGLTPILTHPERNPTLQSDPGRIKDWLRGGVLIQVTADSVIGKMGKTAQKAAHQLLTDRWVHFLATDAHNTGSRPPRMRDAAEMVAKRYGADYARRLCTDNPMAAFRGEPLGEQAEPVGIYEEFKQKTWWQRLTDRGLES